MTIRLEQIISENLERLPNEPFLCWQNTWWSRGAFLELVKECEERLLESRFKAGQKIALLLPNSPISLALNVAIWRLQGTVVSIDYRGAYITLIKQLVHADVFAAITFMGCENIAPLISEEGIPCYITSLVAPGDTIAGRAALRETTDNAVIFYTSGTTGESKAVALSHANLLSVIDSCVEHLGDISEDDILLNALPNFNAFGFLSGSLISLVKAIPQVTLQSFMPAKTTWNIIKQNSVTIIPAVPTMIALLLGAAGQGLDKTSNLKYILSGGDKLPENYIKRCTEILGVPIIEGYGLTEASSVVSLAPGVDGIKPGKLGTLLSCVESKICDDTGAVLPPGQEGQLWIRGESVASSYYHNDELTERYFADGWFNTSDIAKFDEEGYLSLVGRTTDVIFVGGFKVYAGEVETVISEHPAVAEVSVVGVPRSISGEIVKAFIVLKEGEKITSKELIEICKKKLSYYKVPRIVEFVQKLPSRKTW
ncbi:MAG: long-chain fatty acid--CoA ligase [Synergistaceae bacterium]|nr:long-chain fatty acid--CoA ligase [Synergistaceae bacterium]